MPRLPVLLPLLLVLCALGCGTTPLASTPTSAAAGTPTPLLTLSALAFAFPSTAAGAASPSQILTLTNPGTATLNLSSIRLDDKADFTYTTTCAATLAPAASCTVTLAFTPQTVGTFLATITFTDDAATSPQAVTLTGTSQPVATAVNLTASSLKAAPGDPLLFTAQLTPAAATGTVSFLDGSTTLATVALTGGAATFTTGALTPGTHSITASYLPTGNYTASTSAAVTITLAYTPPSGTAIDPTNPAILYSPFNWSVTPGYARTINAGAYFRTLFSGTSLTLTVDPTPDIAPFTQLWARIDEGPWTRFTLAAYTPNLVLATGLASRKHTVEVIVKSLSITLPRWSSSRNVLQVTGLYVDPGATVYAPVRRSKNILVFGDSITAGERTLNNTAAYDTDQADILGDYAYALSTSVDAEVGIVGFGGTGLVNTGSGAVPPLPYTWNYLSDGVPRSFTSPAPDLVIYNEGTNDQLNIVAPFVAVIQAVEAAAPNAKQLLLVPFNQAHAAEFPTIVSTVNDSRVTMQTTLGWWDPADSSDYLHPYDYAHTQLIAPRLMPVVSALLK